MVDPESQEEGGSGMNAATQNFKGNGAWGTHWNKTQDAIARGLDLIEREQKMITLI